MIIFPAVDIKDGQCVRLKQGLEHEVTVFSNDPVQMASHWEELGAKWLHLVDLDGAFSGRPKNFRLIEKICQTVNIPVQLGGGIRDLDIAKAYIDAGVTRIIIGTMALEDKELFAKLCALYPGQVGVSLDAENGKLKSKGWVEDTGVTIEQAIPELIRLGSAFIIFTDITRDGMQVGVNQTSLQEVLNLSSVPVIVAGGIATLEDIKKVYPLKERGLEGVITGRAIYSGSLDFKEAIEWLESQG
ncbi:1-(5-phosphoribosyl)-5-[(5-phosphoribosylamino)methylideneamino]imidazole-4-carboxamide isomerase [Desulfohalobiaceae bacterium Ax17]|jgi:phosphoribosylformimino-5-aminoimidazole carboxamide ribotide isomerase|uniref:1-(5-phosphoribosyl)-5-[(5- phosphoribosylamino)methylideneamino]imidazole-4- carboxamide isomerase n=1 Tax=Desulfovulcanus ferrireducens TaxID=2831190 RepID=UPI00207BB7D8|nr:1-(5-phosphoribosyl)-5-[(5-phosphoribosylamino)methylideneamino]imidazole-4-carboxamide isomerase [Desulfovulcanus ferrireducens]MBT8762410.1 1-(5-phosphoribosyl)-5-[(5-phosphoribosylamino)methylideneamino]imidazole-4-carboxamide isomerase [Desulfovulcanus ferrireducens]